MSKWFQSSTGGSNKKNNSGKKQPKTTAPSKIVSPNSKINEIKQNANQKNNSKTPPKNDKKKPKTSTNKSKDSISSSDSSKSAVNQFESRLSSLNGKPGGQHIFDVCGYVIHCCKHGKIAVSVEETNKYIWLPFISLSSSRAWSDGALDGVNIVLSGGDPNALLALKGKPVIERAECMQIFRLQLPQTQKFNVRLIYYIKLNAKGFKCCSDKKRIQWRSLDDIKNNKITKMWGPEVVLMAQSLSKPIAMSTEEYSLDDAFKYIPREPPQNLEEKMLKSANFTEKDIERLYSDFIDHCFPSIFMTQISFNDYMSKYGFEKMDKKLELLFKAFNFLNTKFLGFHELLLGLTCIDPNANHGESRIRFVFKYFDIDGDGYLNQKEFTSMTREIYPKDSESDIKRKVKEHMKVIGIKKNGVFFEDFYKACGAHKYRGTSVLCRSNKPIVQQISRSIATRNLKKMTTKSSLGSILEGKKYNGICQSCKEKKFKYATHLVGINNEGRCHKPKPLPELSKLDNQEKSESVKTVSKTTSTTGVTGYTNEKFSKEVVWNPKSMANSLIEMIREFNLKKGSHKDNKGLMDGNSERGPFVKQLKEVCTEVEKILAQEERCVRVSSPTFVIGDIHGNIEDMFTMERVLWKSIPIIGANFIFLGDYVDRGKWGLECALYLMCLKLLAPNKIILLRGNHEVRALQSHYSYKRECLQKYGDSLGREVFEATNRVFDKLPFCAVIDDAIYCAHGGIPASSRQIENINKVKTDLRDPEKESAIAWEILWSDPIGPQQFAEAADLLKVRVDTTRGFLTNTKRGTGFLFGEDAANNFLQSNGLTHIIRAHEVPAQGFTFHFGNRCTTIFSSSHYCGNNNEAAVVHIDNEKLRIIRLDTVNNQPANS